MSTTNNNGPYVEGQTLIVLDDSPGIGDNATPAFKKDDRVKVIEVGCWGHVRVEAAIERFWSYTRFAPINPSYSDATQSILEQFRKDEAVKDKCDSPVKEIINQ